MLFFDLFQPQTTDGREYYVIGQKRTFGSVFVHDIVEYYNPSKRGPVYPTGNYWSAVCDPTSATWTQTWTPLCDQLAVVKYHTQLKMTTTDAGARSFYVLIQTSMLQGTPGYFFAHMSANNDTIAKFFIPASHNHKVKPSMTQLFQYNGVWRLRLGLKQAPSVAWPVTYDLNSQPLFEPMFTKMLYTPTTGTVTSGTVETLKLS